jgi:hypothetical protein
MPTPNVELAERVLARIEANPAQWNQGLWALRTACGTAYCFAGWAVKLALPQAEFLFGRATYSDTQAVHAYVPEEGEASIQALAAEALGLGSEAADVLFWGENTLDDLRGYVRSLKEEGWLAPTQRYLDADGDQEEDDDAAY